MKNVITKIGILSIVSLYFFPFSIVGIPFFNTKMVMAILGLLLLGWDSFANKEIKISKDIFHISILAGLVSLCGLISVTFNNTPDYAYAQYIISMWVWLSAAYIVYRTINIYHNNVSVFTISNYLIGVCLFQCIIAQVIDYNHSFKNFVDRYIEQGQVFCTEVERLYGIGASLDVAGSRFAAVLIIIAVIIVDIHKTDKNKFLVFYIISYALIAILGNMIARTTSIGIAISMIYLIYKSNIYRLHLNNGYKKIAIWLVGIILIATPIMSHLYDTNTDVRKGIRFAFEAYFKYVETGSFKTDSTEKLKTMYVYPNMTKTWIIGDGYFSSPFDTDPYYNGKRTGGYYMGTDVGYLRFIFYFGTVGLICFSILIIQIGKICALKFNDEKILFYLLILLNFTIWLKVSTDIFLVFALFFMVKSHENNEYNRLVSINT